MLIGIDIGGSFIKGGIISLNGRVITEHSPVPTGAGPDVVAAVRRLVTTLQELAGRQNPVEALGISTCGVVDPYQGKVLENNSIPGYTGTNWEDELADLQLPFLIENDARSATWAEYQAREEREIDNWIHLPIGTNVGAGIVIHGELWGGSSHNAGEIGHITIDEKGPICSCGNIGCLEGFVSKQGLFSYVREELSRGRESIIPSLPGGQREIDLQIMSEAESQGDPLASEAFQRMGHYLGVGLTTLVNLFNPTIITIGGGTIMTSETILETAQRYVRNHALRSARAMLTIRKGRLGNKAGVIGAALLAHIKATRNIK